MIGLKIFENRNKRILVRFCYLLFFLGSPLPPLSAAPFVENGDGTVTDSGTSLRWQKCSYGQNNDISCSGTATMTSWQGALAYCNGLSLAGRAWRLPSARELWSLVDLTKRDPTIDSVYFPATVTGAWKYYWTSTSSVVPDSSAAYNVSFYDGRVLPVSVKSGSYAVRCVSEGP